MESRKVLGSRSAFIQKMDKIDSLGLDGLGTNNKQNKITDFDGRMHWLPWSNLNESFREC